MRKITGAQAFIEALRCEGVTHAFGYPGGAVLDIFDAIMDARDIQFILSRHEQGAVHAADGYARASGRVGVCLVTSGPGATNTVTGIATAYMDSIPIVVFTGQVPTHLIGNDAFQEADIVGITRPCTKHNYLVKDVCDLGRVIKEAFYIARTGRPGPVLVDLPKDVMKSTVNFKYPDSLSLESYCPTYKGHPGQIRRIMGLILKSRHPVIYAGGGVTLAGASKELSDFARRLQLPVTTTLMGMGAFPSGDPLSLGMLGMHGTYAANMTVTNSDCLIAIGARFDDRVTGKVDEFAPKAKIIHIDIDPTSISKNVKVDLPVVGDCRMVLRGMLAELAGKDAELAEMLSQTASWRSEIEVWKEQQPLRYCKSEIVKPQYVIEMIDEIAPDDTIITTEVGQNQMWTAQFYKFNEPRLFLTSGGLGTMGYGFPAAIGAQVAFPGRTVIDIAGDGSIQMNIQELATAVQYDLPVKVMILNNGYLGMVRQWQSLFYKKRYSHTSMAVSPDFVKLAEAYGAKGLRVTRPEDVKDAIREALRIPGPVIVDFVVDPEEDVYPMVPAGAPINNMLLV
ncbi:MAG: biosynthetic-type acetolactate synthase large subunit [Desulfomonilia bacterium]|jgi:acetolactate synthase-1/2/3 large subunit|nr:biosynthetic-type acetolactate synthase large subunit [Deltaproteobacteria bacterium]MDX9761038.1 biosynthetic-type acetolactate synthase large subunit [Desulfomonilia bacterium]HPW68218.1 biosynthetic-type acetolactate synthase large subunit [Deltaproteobacteria bacterium]